MNDNHLIFGLAIGMLVAAAGWGLALIGPAGWPLTMVGGGIFTLTLVSHQHSLRHKFIRIAPASTTRLLAKPVALPLNQT